MKEVARYKNEMNTLSIGKWTAEEMNFLFAILTQVRDEGSKELKFDTYDLREYVEFDRTQPKRWNKTMIAVTKKISQLVYFNMEDNVFEAMPLFRKFSVKLDEQVVTVRVSEEMEYILKQYNSFQTKRTLILINLESFIFQHLIYKSKYIISMRCTILALDSTFILTHIILI